MKPIVAQAVASNDRYRTLLRKSLQVLSEETVAAWVSQIEEDMHNQDIEIAQRMESNAMIVGVLSVMLEGIADAEQAAKEGE